MRRSAIVTAENMLVGFALVPIAVASNYLRHLVGAKGVSTEMFFRIAYVLMFVIAVELMRSSIVELVVGLALRGRLA